MMYEKISDLIKQIALGEDSVLELKAMEFSGRKITGLNKDGMADELAAIYNACTVIEEPTWEPSVCRVRLPNQDTAARMSRSASRPLNAAPQPEIAAGAWLGAYAKAA